MSLHLCYSVQPLHGGGLRGEDAKQTAEMGMDHDATREGSGRSRLSTGARTVPSKGDIEDVSDIKVVTVDLPKG